MGGKLIVIIGDSGAGKSTLARIMEAGLREMGKPVTVVDAVEWHYRSHVQEIEMAINKRIHTVWNTVIVTSIEPGPDSIMRKADRVIEISWPEQFSYRRMVQNEGILQRIIRKVRGRFV